VAVIFYLNNLPFSFIHMCIFLHIFCHYIYNYLFFQSHILLKYTCNCIHTIFDKFTLLFFQILKDLQK